MRRGRQRKGARLSRMDAAIDAMAPFGFAEAQVKKCVTQLLRVYGGDVGWPFIEEYGYKELLEALLRGDEKDDQENAAEDDDGNMKDKSTEDETAAGTSSRVSDTQPSERPEEDNAPADTAESYTTAATKPSHLEHLSSASVGGDVWKDILLSHPSGDSDEAATAGDKSSNSDPAAKTSTLSENPILASMDNISLPLPPNSPPPRRRMPCYGWIESDEEELREFMFLKPAPGTLQAKPTPRLKRVRFETEARRKRQSRWDQRPDDP